MATVDIKGCDFGRAPFAASHLRWVGLSVTSPAAARPHALRAFHCNPSRKI